MGPTLYLSSDEMDSNGGSGNIAGPSRGSSAPKSNCPIVIKHISNPKKISLLPSSASTAPDFLGNKDKMPTYKTLSRDSSSSSATFIAHNEDLLIQILLFLPPKSLLRFQSVSKQWLSIISDPAFCRLHCRKYPSSSSSLFLYRRILRGRELNFISFRKENVKSMGTLTSRLFNVLAGDFESMHSCNGLVCMLFNSNHCNREIVVYNPTTNQSRIIPLQIKPVEKYDIRVVNIAFDPSLSDHYKLVCLWCDRNEVEFCFTVYSSEIGVWSKPSKTYVYVDDNGLEYFFSGVFWNGNLHWVGQDWSILCVDVDNVCLGPEIPRPPNPSDDCWRICYFGESGAHLFFIGQTTPQPVVLEVYSLQRDYSEWVVKYSIDVASLFTLYSSMLSDEEEVDLEMPCFVVDDKEKKAMALISVEGKLISYEINNMTVEEIAELDLSHLQEWSYSLEDVSKYSWWDKYSWLDSFHHTETLAYI